MTARGVRTSASPAPFNPPFVSWLGRRVNRRRSVDPENRRKDRPWSITVACLCPTAGTEPISKDSFLSKSPSTSNGRSPPTSALRAHGNRRLSGFCRCCCRRRRCCCCNSAATAPSARACVELDVVNRS
jgi:hypothetical protein